MAVLSNIMALIADTRWAMTPSTLDAIVSIVERDSHASYSDFHKESKDAYIGDLGNSVPGTRYSTVHGNTGIITVDGPIVPRAGMMRGASAPEIASYERLSSEFAAFDSNPNIDTILFVLDSPGGSVTGLSEFGAMIRASSKRTQAFVMGNAASAAYWIASSAKEVYSSKTGEVGSIGTVATLRDFREAEKRAGIKTTEIVSSVSPYKRRDYDTDEGRAAIQKVVDQLGEIFVATVAENRNTTKEAVIAKFGQGDMLVAEDALAAGMIDGITTLRELLDNNSNITIGGIMPTDNVKADAGTPAVLSADEFKASNPQAYQDILALGASAERDRISALDAIQHPAAKDLVAAAKLDPKGNAADVKAAFADLVLSGKVAMEAPKTDTSAHSDAAHALATVASTIASGSTVDPKTAETDSVIAAMISGGNNR